MTFRRPSTLRRLSAAGILLVLAATACAAATAGPRADVAPALASDAATGQQLCADIPHRWLQRMANAYREDFSGDLQYLPRYPNPVDGGLSHAGPWDHLQHVPLLLWGPGYVKPGVYDQEASLVDVAPTSAELVKFPYTSPDGRRAERGAAPRRSTEAAQARGDPGVGLGRDQRAR